MNSVEIIKRNSVSIPITMYYKGEELLLGTSDYLVFTVRENIDSGEYLIRKEIKSENYNEDLNAYLLNFLPEDTDEVELNDYNKSQSYFFDITLHNTDNENVNRTILRGNFIVSWRASMKGDGING